MSLSTIVKTATLLSTLNLSLADVITPLYPIAATDGALKWQPVLDWDKDTCYHTAAIDPNGNTNPGLETTPQVGPCRQADRLSHCNAYSRERCNHGWCVYMYGYYSEMDNDAWANAYGHRHDWEHAMVWIRGDAPWSVMWSAHGDCKSCCKKANSLGCANYLSSDSDADPREVRWEGDTHPKLVAHHGGARTGSLRLAKGDDDNIENDFGRWFTCHLQSREKMNDWIGHKLMTTDFGSAHIDLTDEKFPEVLEKYMPKQARADGFDAWH